MAFLSSLFWGKKVVIKNVVTTDYVQKRLPVKDSLVFFIP
jgi:hypothetical protein